MLCLAAYGAQTGSDPTTPKDNLWLGVALLVVVIITAIFAYYQESKAGKIMESFKKLVNRSIHLDGGNERSFRPHKKLSHCEMDRKSNWAQMNWSLVILSLLRSEIKHPQVRTARGMRRMFPIDSIRYSSIIVAKFQSRQFVFDW